MTWSAPGRRAGRPPDLPDRRRVARYRRDVSPDLALALRLADAADAISLPLFRSGLPIETKPDLTPVTEADRAVETELRRMLAAERPGDAILGEEHGATAGGARRWILDPIDGTRNYARGSPIWATLVALEELGVVRLGVVSAPALGRRWWAERGRRRIRGRRADRCFPISTVEDAVLCLALESHVPRARASRLARARARRLLGAHARGRGRRRRSDRRSRGERVGSRRGSGHRRGGGGHASPTSPARARIDSGTAVSSNGLLHEELLAALAAP